jgi:transposase-like protein
MSGKKGMRHYPAAIKLEAVRMFQAGKTHGEITQALGIGDLTRPEKWMRAYLEIGGAAFHKSSKKGLVGRPPKKENTQAYIARLEMEVALLMISIVGPY